MIAFSRRMNPILIMANDKPQLRLAAVADIHCTKKSADSMRSLLSAMAHETDILLLGGDLCDAGLPEEAEILARELAILKVPVVAVLGNDDFEAGRRPRLSKFFQTLVLMFWMANHAKSTILASPA